MDEVKDMYLFAENIFNCLFIIKDKLYNGCQYDYKLTLASLSMICFVSSLVLPSQHGRLVIASAFASIYLFELLMLKLTFNLNKQQWDSCVKM